MAFAVSKGVNFRRSDVAGVSCRSRLARVTEKERGPPRSCALVRAVQPSLVMANSLQSSECSRGAQSGPCCRIQLAVAEGVSVAPNGGSARVLRGFRSHSACCRPPISMPVDPALTAL
jgi:hypothetical protein